MPVRKRLDFYALCIRLDWRPSTLYQHIQNGWLPKPSKAGKRVFWYEDEINQWEAAGFPKPCDKEQEECPSKQQIR